MRLQSNWQPGLDHGWKIHFWDGALTWPAADRRPQLLPMWTPPQGWLRFLTTFLRASNPRWQNENHHVFYNLAFKVTLLNFHSILVVTQDSPVESGREQHDSVYTRKWRSLGAILETGFHSSVGQDWQQIRVDSLGGKNRGRQIITQRNHFREWWAQWQKSNKMIS